MAQIIKTDGTIIDEVQPKNGTDFQLEELQAVVDGYIQIVQLGDGEIMVVNEEGKFYCEWNGTATTYAKMKRAIRENDYVSGNVLVCNINQVK